MLRYLFIALIALLSASTSSFQSGQLELLIHNIKSEQGKLWIGIYPSKEAFLDKDQARLVEVEISHLKSQKVVVDDLAYGDYAIALFHDLNANNELDLNWLGVPQEPFAFSRPAPSKWRLPEFDEVKINLSSASQLVKTDLQTWWER